MSVNTTFLWQSISSNWHKGRRSLFKKKYFHICNCIKTYHIKSLYFKTLVYRLRVVIMKMVCRLHSTYFIVNYIIFGSDSSYVNVQRSSPHWHCPIHNANKTIVEIWTSKCWIKVNADDFSAGGVGIRLREYDTPSSLYFGIEIVYKIYCLSKFTVPKSCHYCYN